MINPNPNSWPLPTPRIVRFPTPFGNKNLLSLVMHQCTLVAGSDSYLGSAFGQASSAPCSVNRD